jgi:hypothetical protein
MVAATQVDEEGTLVSRSQHAAPRNIAAAPATERKLEQGVAAILASCFERIFEEGKA